MGDIEKPGHEHWQSGYSNAPKASYIMILVSIVINYSQLFVMPIVLMNLLIAIISEQYGKAKAEEEIYLYIDKADMILEASIQYDD